MFLQFIIHIIAWFVYAICGVIAAFMLMDMYENHRNKKMTSGNVDNYTAQWYIAFALVLFLMSIGTTVIVLP